ncbi:unnamed protein product [Parnassius apollo]|uniref:(apollo) hypothetical protein n=1 Tax=Parnassius apollo TaxID=110799 RepID=A0A8S3Y3Z8_PARAO|nr:unnamed protein product [Parnassius apollo]
MLRNQLIANGTLRNQTQMKPSIILDSSDDENMSDDYEYLVSKPLQQVLIPESNQESQSISSSNVEASVKQSTIDEQQLHKTKK